MVAMVLVLPQVAVQHSLLGELLEELWRQMPVRLVFVAVGLGVMLVRVVVLVQMELLELLVPLEICAIQTFFSLLVELLELLEKP